MSAVSHLFKINFEEVQLLRFRVLQFSYGLCFSALNFLKREITMWQD